MDETPQQIPNQQPVEPQPQSEQQIPIQPEQPVVMPQQPHTRWLFLLLALVVGLAAYAGVAYWQNMWPFSPDKEVVVTESPTPTPNQELEAFRALELFFIRIHKEQYEKAVSIFEPKYQHGVTVPVSWEGLKTFVLPELRDDKAKVLEGYCASVPTCFLAMEIINSNKESDDLYTFTVQFRQDDGSVYETSTLGVAPESEFIFGVERIDEVWKVITTPIFTP